jgi:plasmid maintenance system antidote protein VapI
LTFPGDLLHDSPVQKTSEFAKILKEEWNRRRGVNRRYSLRAYASALAISPSRLSDFLNGKGGLSAARAVEVADRLNLSAAEFAQLRLIIHAELQIPRGQKPLGRQQLRQLKQKFDTYRSLSSRESLERLSLEHLYIAELVADVAQSEAQISRRLQIHPGHLPELLADAAALDLIQPVAERPGYWQGSDATWLLGNAQASAAIRRLHFRLLQDVPKICEKCDYDERELSSALMQLNRPQIETLRGMIREFTKSCVAEANRKKDPGQRLYGLSLQLFPLEASPEALP